MRKLHRSLAMVGGMVALGAVSLAIASPASAIEGGFTVQHSETDMAQIWYSGPDGTQNEFFCSGVVINRYKVLTANHCFWNDSNISHYYVRTGATERGKGKRLALHGKEARGDLAILDTVASVDTNGAPYAELAPNEKVPSRKVLSSYGWGRTCGDPNCGSAYNLKMTDTKVNGNDDALRVYNKINTPAAYTVRPMIKSKIRKGDSGGPSGYFKNGVRIVTGIAWKVDEDDAYMAATYDAKNCDPKMNCVHDWLKNRGRMKQHRDNVGARVGTPHDELRKRDPHAGAGSKVDENHDDPRGGVARSSKESVTPSGS